MVKNLPTQKIIGPEDLSISVSNSIQTLKQVEEEGTTPHSLYEASVTSRPAILIHHKKSKLQIDFPHGHRCKCP